MLLRELLLAMPHNLDVHLFRSSLSRILLCSEDEEVELFGEVVLEVLDLEPRLVSLVASWAMLGGIVRPWDSSNRLYHLTSLVSRVESEDITRHHVHTLILLSLLLRVLNPLYQLTHLYPYLLLSVKPLLVGLTL